MANAAAASERDYLIADARHLRAAFQKHWAQLKEFGAREAMLKHLDQCIVAAEVAQDSSAGKGSQEQLGQARLELKDLIGDCRASSRLVAFGLVGDDAAAARALKVKSAFPHSDRNLLDICGGLGAGLKKYSGKLADYGFKKDAQDALIEKSAAFAKLLALRRKEKSGKRGQGVAREASVKQLRRAIRFLRELGRRAMGDTVDRTDFAPVSKLRAPQRKAAPQPVPTPPPAGKSTAA